MENLAVISSSLVLLGAVFMTAAIIHARKIRTRVPAELQRQWLVVISFMIFFLAGYVLFAAILLGNLQLPHELVTCPIFLGGAIFVFLVVSLTRSTIGRMKAAEEKLRLLNESLEQKVEERTRELMAAQEELLRREKLAMLNIVAGNVGNELRNPLGVMSNAVFFLENRLSAADELVREYLEIIRKEIGAAQQVLSDFSIFFRTRTPRVQALPVEELINRSLAGCVVPESVTVTVGVELPETGAVLKVDPGQMQQVFRKLIDNAVQAMPNGGVLRVSTRRAPDPGFIAISVTDSGGGIALEHREKIFEPLFSTRSRGIGLGLPIAKNLVEANAGRIKVESEPGQGTTFTVVLPYGCREPLPREAL
jgi:signal transduction histidine kinase